MKTVFRLVIALAFAFGAAGMRTPAVQAAAPGNDVSSGATLVTLGFSETLSTVEATTDADDAQLNASCGAPATDASVWYVLDGTDQGVIVDVSGSSYTAGVLVGVGSPGSLTTVACGPGTVSFFATAGTTYYILAIDDQQDGGGNGGTLNISFAEVPPPPEVTLTVNPYGTFDSKTGVATISGKYTCLYGDFIELSVHGEQYAGRFTVQGDGYFVDFGTCDGVPHNWTASVYPQGSKFAGGTAMSVTFAYSCGAFECGYGYAEQQVILRGKKK